MGVATSASTRDPFSAAPEPRPTHVRHGVLIAAVTLAVITYIDRVCISQAAPLIRASLGLTPVQMGWAFSAFTWSYALFEIPGGWLGDRFGPRRILMRVVLWWSFFTAATGWVWNETSLLGTRALFGAGEAGCFPNLTRAFTTWLPKGERDRAQAILWLSARWGGAFTPVLVAFLLDYVSWRRAFELLGALGILWALAFYRWYRDDPSAHPAINRAELAMLPAREETARVHGAIDVRLFRSSPVVWLLWAQYACLSYGWYFYITWLPTYLRDARGVGLKQGALLAGLPLFLGGIGSLVSGLLSTHLARVIGVVPARRLLAVSGFFGAAALMFVFTTLASPTIAMLVLGLSSFCNDLAMPPSWGACMDVGGRFSGTVSGGMNMAGNLGGGVSPLIIGYLLARTSQNWTLAFYVSAAVYLVGGLCWFFIDSHTPLKGAVVTSESPE
jgi:MFS transporter, ACS family, glucarate transporter